MDADTLFRLNAARRARRGVVLVTDLAGGEERLVNSPGELDGPEWRGEIEERFRTGRSGRFETGGRSYLLSVHLPNPRIVAVGAVHISQVLAPMAKLAGYDLEIVDPRTAFATAERFPDVAVYAEWPEDRLRRQPLDPYTALAALTHDPKIDDMPLSAALEAGCFYVGALGSRKTHAQRLQRLAQSGRTPAELERIRAPIGLDIGASGPAEIAVAVLAEIIASFRARSSTRGP